MEKISHEVSSLMIKPEIKFNLTKMLILFVMFSFLITETHSQENTLISLALYFIACLIFLFETSPHPLYAKNPNKYFTYKYRDTNTIEIKRKNKIFLFKNTAKFKIINKDNRIALKNIDTNEESQYINKEEFFKVINLKMEKNAND